VTSADISPLGIFEHRPQQEFVGTLIEWLGPSHGHNVIVERRLTGGCRFDNLNDHLGLAGAFGGVVIGVDGAGLRRGRKIEKLEGRCEVPPLRLWAIAEPSVEEWMMADPEALPTALIGLFGADRVGHAARPGHSNAERTAKARLREWIERLLGEPVLQGGVEYAADVARQVRPAHIGRGRNPDLAHFLAALPGFLEQCAVR
jgi:hypothetical protein